MATRPQGKARSISRDTFFKSVTASKNGRRRRRSRLPAKKRAGDEEWSENERCAAALPPKEKPNKLESRFWGFQVYHESVQDLAAINRALEEKHREEERVMERLEMDAQRERDLLDMKGDYYKLINLVNRFGACPGHIYCISKFPGREYEQYLQQKGASLVLWWRRCRIRRLGY